MHFVKRIMINYKVNKIIKNISLVMVKLKTQIMKKEFLLQNQLFKGVLLIAFLVMVNPDKIYSQKMGCKAKLELINDKPNKLAGESGTTYRMKLTNIGVKKEFVITVYKSKQINAKNNNAVDLNNMLEDFYLKEMTKSYTKEGDAREIYEVLLNKGEEIIFYLRLNNPNRAKIGSKYTTQVDVTSSKCPDLYISKTLNTEFIDGE